MSSYGSNNSSNEGPRKIYGGIGASPTTMKSAIEDELRKEEESWVHPITKFFRLFKKKKKEG